MVPKRILTTLILGLAALAPAGASAQGVYTIAEGFTGTSSPIGSFTFGQYANGGFKPFEHAGTTTIDSQTLSYKNNATGPVDPNVFYNPGTSDANTAPDFGDEVFPAGKVTFGPYLGPTVARFTASAAETINLSTTFQTVQQGNDAPTAYVYVGSTLVDSHQLQIDPNDAQYGIAYSFSKTALTLAKNETIDIVVYGGDSNNKTTRVDATITVVPEPATALMCGTAALLGLGLAWRRRRAAIAA